MAQIVLLTSGPSTGGMALYRTIGAYKIAHQCRKNGYTVQVIDHINFFTQEELTKLLEKFVDNDTYSTRIKHNIYFGLALQRHAAGIGQFY